MNAPAMSSMIRFGYHVLIAAAILATASPGAAEPSPAPSPGAAVEAGPASHWDFADDDSFPIELRHVANVVDSAGGYVVVRATVNGKAGTFLLDTGASGTILTQDFAESLHFEALGRSGLYGVAGKTVASTVVAVKDLGIGKSVLHDVRVSVASNDSGALGRHLDGTLGYDVFARALVDVDLSTQRMRVYDPARFEPTVTKKSYVFDVDLTNRQPRIAGTIGNGVVIHPIFDTGNELLLSLSDSLRDGNKLTASHVGTLYFSGIDGRTSGVDCGRVNRATFGPINYDGPIVCFFNGRIFGKDGGILGFDFLQHFNWTIDYPDKKFVLTPNGL